MLRVLVQRAKDAWEYYVSTYKKASRAPGQMTKHVLGGDEALNVKSTSPDTENHDKNGYVFKDNNKNFIMTNVDNSDTKYTNKNDTEQSQHARPAQVSTAARR